MGICLTCKPMQLKSGMSPYMPPGSGGTRSANRTRKEKALRMPETINRMINAFSQKKTNMYYGENKWRMNILVTLSAK